MYKVQSLSAQTRRSPKARTRSRKATVTRAVLPVIDTLESRQMFSGSVTLVSGILKITGDGKTSANMQLNTGSNSTVYATNGLGATGSFSASSVKGVVFTGGSGNDTIYEATNILIPTTINSGEGKDNIRTGGGTNVVNVGDGDSWINARGTRDTVTVGDGDDTILASNLDTVVAGNGNVHITGGSSITVGNGNDTIGSGTANDYIKVGNGNDSINGGLGNDTFVCGTGLDTLYGGSGTNVMTIGNAKDVIQGSSGTNKVTLTSGAVVSDPNNGTTTTPSTVAGSNSWVKYTATKSSDSTAPQAVMEVLAPALTVGIAIDVRAVASIVGAGSAITTNYQWNFGDSAGEYNTLDGYNASHIYQTAGTYTVKLTITNDLGKTSTVSVSLKIAADTRKKIYVDSVAGNDSNTGSISAPLKTAAAAAGKIANDTEVLFKRGDTFVMDGTFKVAATDVMIDAYGSGANPIMTQSKSITGNAVLFSTWYNNYGMTIQNLQFSSQSPSTGVPFAVVPRGVDETVRDCTFLNVEYGINGNGGPIGFNLIGSTAPNMTSVQGYLFWVQGNDITIIGNKAVNSVHEHIIRTSSVTDELIADNNFTNEDGKGCIEVHVGSYAWVVGNTVTDGDIRVGPLGLWGESASSATDYAVIENNLVINAPINVDPGSHHISIRNNIIKQDSDTQLININSVDSSGRYAQDIQILNNTGIDTNSYGNFLKVNSATKGIILDNNLLVMPSLSVGAYTTAPVYVDESALTSFTQITGNVWQTPKTPLAWANGGVNYVSTIWASTGYITAAKWNTLAVVGTDLFTTTSLSSSYTPASGSVAATADTAVAGVYTDYYGKTRSTSGKWSAGAVQA